LAQPQKIDPPRIFISHAWEDKALVRQIEKALAEAGAEVWVDHAGIRGGDNLPERISDALDWCNTLLLIWSKAAAGSRWVKLEWTNAIMLDKLVIPCPLEKTVLPSLLANTAYIDFSNRDQGLRDLLRALQLAKTGGEDFDLELAGVIHARLSQTAPPLLSKPPQDEPKASPPVGSTIIQLRHTPVNPLSGDAALQMLRDKDFFDTFQNKSGKGIQHQYESVEQKGVKLVLDHATGLTWQQVGSENQVSFNDAASHIQQLNAKNYGGYEDWRLPTLEEAMSLMEPKKHGELYLDPVFDRTQWWIWTADLESAGRAWSVSFGLGSCHLNDIGNVSYVRAVRS
jgi:hypothetical protein